MLVKPNKPDVTRRGIEMAGIKEAVTKELELQVSLKVLVPLSSFYVANSL